jgi:hypothetical protein
MYLINVNALLSKSYPTSIYSLSADEDLTEPLVEKYIRLLTSVYSMPTSKRDMYICFSKVEISLLEDFARNKGTLNIGQALESLAKERNNEN